jgi:hypothetical protein
MDFIHCKEHGVFFATVEAGVSEFLNSFYPDFDLDQVVQELEDVAKKWGFEWGRKHIEILPSGNLFIHYQYDDLLSDKLDDSLTLKRILKKPDVHGRRVAHQEMFLPEGLQNQGLSRDLVHPFFVQYKKSKVDFIDAIAGDKGGGYALAKYGFAAVDKKEVFAIVEGAASRGVPQAVIDFLLEDANEFYNTHPLDSPFPMWEWAKSPHAKRLLRGTSWRAVLNLQDILQEGIFKTYLYPERNIFVLL